MSAISSQSLTRKFGDFTAVDNLTLEVAKGEIFGFLGANGSGKTTAIRMFCGLLAPTSGSAIVAGIDVAKQPDAVKTRIGYMSQRFSLYEDLTVKENLAFYGGVYGLNRKEIKDRSNELLDRLGFKAQENTLIQSLPLGWRQKLAFSAALLHRPEIVFLDEPTGGVDPITRRQFWELIYETAATGVTVLVTTHYMDEAEYCTRVSIMVNGRMEALGSSRELKQQYGVDNMDALFFQIARPGGTFTHA